MKEFVEESVAFPGETLDETVPGFQQRVQGAGVLNAPTILVFDDNREEIFRTDDTEVLRDFLIKNNY